MIQAEQISMNYGTFQAVTQCSFTVEKGEIVGLLGPNGAGKTTIMKILSTQIYPSAGSARVAGYDCETQPKKVRASVGYLPEEAPLYDDMEVREYLDFVARGRGLEGNVLRKRLLWVKENCGLGKKWCRPIGELSKGFRQRVGLAQALVHDPPVLILDEPTSGLDPLQIIEIRDLIKTLSRDKAILFSSHIIQEIMAVSDRIVIISDGKIRADGPIAELEKDVEGEATVRFCIESGGRSIKDEIESIKWALRVEERSEAQGVLCYEIRTNSPEELMKTLGILASREGITVLELSRSRPEFEKVFTALIHGHSPN